MPSLQMGRSRTRNLGRASLGPRQGAKTHLSFCAFFVEAGEPGVAGVTLGTDELHDVQGRSRGSVMHRDAVLADDRRVGVGRDRAGTPSGCVDLDFLGAIRHPSTKLRLNLRYDYSRRHAAGKWMVSGIWTGANRPAPTAEAALAIASRDGGLTRVVFAGSLVASGKPRVRPWSAHGAGERQIAVIWPR